MARMLKLIFTTGLLFAMGCERPTGNSTKISIQAPAAYGKVGAMSSMPINRKACYAVNVVGTKTNNSPTNSCNPMVLGDVAGFVEAGGQMNITVASSQTVKIELLAYFHPAGVTAPCPPLGKALTAAQLLNAYLVGKVEKFEVAGPEQVVEITAIYPGDSQYLAQTLAVPATCTTASAPTGPNFPGSIGQLNASSANYRMKANLSSLGSPKVLSGTNFKFVRK